MGSYVVAMGLYGSQWGTEGAGLHSQWACPHVAPPLPVEKAPEEPPAKLLDDLFRKTKAAPCIYWLPLTDSQFSQKQAERQARARERERRRKEQEEAELRARSGRGHDKRGGASGRDRQSGSGTSQPSANQSATPGSAPRSKRRSRSRSTPLRDRGGRR
ncbi:apoptotic chromatin condensation inducer in the nucleus-like [Lagopus leucura]|uniref:apoptotic chromatin condensation inducer in the nucleus-like n=1 Tax=Lagopus leucura TaxID=30410 RepID=UPI001C686E49|nr:apoptotic chromatin condensation inducer in the nucleus-like [Lagopus leucura]